MKIGIVTTWFERGAAYVSKQFKEIWEAENQVFIYARAGEELALNNSNWTVGNICYGKRFDYTNLDLIDLKHFQSWIEDNKLDLVFFNEQHIWDPVLLCHQLGVKIGSYIDYYTPQTVELFGIFDFLICNTKRHHSVFSWHNGAYYIPWGTDQSIFNQSQRHLQEPDMLVFFHSAGMNPYRKGTDLLLLAFDKVKNSKSKLLIHTQQDLDVFFPEHRQLVLNLVKDGYLEVINMSIPAPGLYHRGDVYVYPSRLDGIGLTVAEALSCGMPVITTNSAPMNEFVSDGLNGSLVDVDFEKRRRDDYYWKESHPQLESLANKMSYYLENINKLEHYKEMALEHAKQNLNWHSNAKVLNQVVQEVFNSEHKFNAQAFNLVKAYEKNRSIHFYVANTKVYQKLKRKIFNLFKLLRR